MKKLLVTTICLLGAHLLSAGEIWISPQGNDPVSYTHLGVASGTWRMVGKIVILFL